MIESQPTQKRKKTLLQPRGVKDHSKPASDEEREAVPLICPTIHPLVMMTVSDGNLKNLQIGSTTHTTDPNHEPPSSAENVLSLSLSHTA